MRQWFASFLQRYEYITLRVRADDGGLTFVVFQVLDLERKSLVVRPYVGNEEAAELDGLYTVSVQPLEVWCPQPGAVEPGETLEVFLFHEPKKIDVITLTGALTEGRRGIYAWKAHLSDVEGCTHPHGKEILANRSVDLLGSSVPVLCLLDALRQKGFVGIDQVVCHTAGCLEFDRRQVAGRRAYLQCVLHMEKVLARGVAEFRSVGPISYFLALLHGKRVVRPGLSALAYRKMLAEDRGDELEVVACEGRAKRRRTEKGPPVAIVAREVVPPLQDESECESVVGGSARDGAPPQAQGGGADAASESDGSIVGGGQQQVDRLAAIHPGGNIPDTIMGGQVTFIPGRSTRTHTYCDRLGVKCINPAHGRCSKTRSMGLLTSRFGARAAEVYLGTWLSKAHDVDAQAHGKYTPTTEEMASYMVAHP